MSCRVCRRVSKTMEHLNDFVRNRQPTTLREALTVCTRLNVREDDGLTQMLCRSCVKELIRFLRFYELAIETDAQLRGLVCHTKTFELLEQTVDTNECAPHVSVRDPLEESDIETSDGRTDGGRVRNGNKSDDDDDDDDDDEEYNKPLNQLIVAKTALEAVESSKVDETAANTSDLLDSEIEMYCDLNNEPAELVPESEISIEAQLFPPGRYKCKKCAQCYFTIVGLKAHLDIHLPQRASAKKRKRSQGPNKKKQNERLEQSEEDSNDVEDASASVVAPIPDPDEPLKKARQPRPPKPKKIFPCPVCGKHMISASKLRYHMVMHTGQKDYLCTMCPKAYSTIYALKHHLRTHTGERPYQCKFCGDKFLRPTTLKSHMRRHTGERPYGCDICGKRFIQHSSMTTHIRLNHMAKNIACPHCDKKYARQTDLNAHLLSHTGDKPFSCQLCPSRFIRQANLNKHMNQHHSGKKRSTKASTNASDEKGVDQGSSNDFIQINDEPRSDSLRDQLSDHDHQELPADSSNTPLYPLFENQEPLQQPTTCMPGATMQSLNSNQWNE